MEVATLYCTYRMVSCYQTGSKFRVSLTWILNVAVSLHRLPFHYQSWVTNEAVIISATSVARIGNSQSYSQQSTIKLNRHWLGAHHSKPLFQTARGAGSFIQGLRSHKAYGQMNWPNCQYSFTTPWVYRGQPDQSSRCMSLMTWSPKGSGQSGELCSVWVFTYVCVSACVSVCVYVRGRWSCYGGTDGHSAACLSVIVTLL